MPSIVSACRFQRMRPGAKVRCPSDPSWRIIEFVLFGSVLRDDFDAESDLDILVAFAPDADWSLLDHVQMEQELEALLGREVDLLSRRSVEGKRLSPASTAVEKTSAGSVAQYRISGAPSHVWGKRACRIRSRRPFRSTATRVRKTTHRS